MPYLEGERTPNLPTARGELHGMTLDNLTRENLARAAVEGLLGLFGAAMRGLRDQGVSIQRVALVGGGARSEAVRRLAPAVWDLPVDVPETSEDVADGAARQAAWVLSGADAPPDWQHRTTRTCTAGATPEVQAAYDEAAAGVAARS